MRLNLEISEPEMLSLEKLQARTGISTKKELVHTAISILKWAVNETAAGNQIAAVNVRKSIYRVLVAPSLQYVAEHELEPEPEPEPEPTFGR
jgi:hypothetical protein